MKKAFYRCDRAFDTGRQVFSVGQEVNPWSVPIGYLEHFTRIERTCFDAHNQTWFAHTPGDPMPCERMEEVFVLRADQNEMVARVSQSAILWCWSELEHAGANIIGWRYADQEHEAKCVQIKGNPEAVSATMIYDADESGLDPDQFSDFAWVEFLLAVAPDVPVVKDESLPTRQRRHWNEMEERQAQKEQAAAAQAELKKSEQAKALQEAADAMGKVNQDHGHRLGWMA